MKVQDLMIGDWVTCSINNKYYKVSELTSDIELEGYGFIFHSLFDDIEPIPLTAEILENNFPTIEDGVTWSETTDSDLFNIRVEYDKYVEGIFRFIHELQHALRLAGIDKEIEL